MSHQVEGTPSEERRKNFVNVVINGSQKEIHRGRQAVGEIKSVGGVPQADVLNQIVERKLQPLADDDAVTIKGGEEFLSHPRDSASS